MGHGNEELLYTGAMLVEGKYPIWLVPVCPECGKVHTYPITSGESDPRQWLKGQTFKCLSGSKLFVPKEITTAKPGN